MLFLAYHEELVSTLTVKTALHQVSQPAGHPSRVVVVTPKFRQDWGKTRRPSPHAADSSDDDPLSDKELGTKSKGRKWDYTSPINVMVVDEDDDEPLPSRTCKTPAKKPKIQQYMAAQQDTLNRLTLRLKSEGQNCQYSHKMANLVKYQNEKVVNLRQGPNTDNHSAHLATIKQRAWSYPAKGNLQMVRQFLRDLVDCGDPEKIKHGEHMLQDQGIAQNSS